MKVVLLMPVAQHLGGAELTFKHLLQHTASEALEWHVVFFSNGPMLSEVQREGVATYVVDTGRLRQPVRFTRAVKSIADIIRKTESELVLSWSAKAHMYGSLAGLRAGRPSIWYQQGNPSGSHLSLIDRIAALFPAKLVLVVSNASSRAQARLRPRREPRVVYPGVDLSAFGAENLPDRNSARKQLGLPPDGPLIGIVGRLQRWKGIHILVKAMPRVLADHPTARCVVVGGQHEMEPDYETYLQGSIEKLRIGDHVRLCGHQVDVPIWMQAMDIVVHASDNEPFGLVVIEAMALGKPVIAANSGGPTEIISDGLNGLLTPFDDVNALAIALNKLLADHELAERIGRQAAIRAKEFDVRSFSARIVQALKDVLEGRPG